ncbi:unnamed protein product [Polarella glacialis]|uniref:Repressor of RNA polymerase III transcription n=1 Tax=Polarella glacialis TaxID=89957 RepID=A0A813L1N3_POLGL|nr:unnamed protein product [Polarella glacialis]|mmetsp:Transcript_68653/g.110660  ORF Transcript_68653/g.110660 Transcript_68653/m.110660 type:complete len:292 (+) Transcript_68653:146-1021(+)|eukprot:CAMPEP_0115116366 /NCGR_PEP_ID=MMETSP0227-20121206/43241_1 /TAXON_ID=89957 /ORGANISM="Polarella glacialis, Strain CCMP 1383" /LENGTH=291 /DNA_ID=CAMNT_0002517207 /DNA_START=158 /DNA_END=1033 /DNA_ORIENTATION=-
MPTSSQGGRAAGSQPPPEKPTLTDAVAVPDGLPGEAARPRAGSGGGGSSAGGFIENSQLTQLSAMLKAIDAGDRIIKGRLELFACSRRRLTQHQQQELERRAPRSLSDSPLGPLADDSSQILLANLRALMSLLFVDYDCTQLTPDDFERCLDKHTVVNTINHSLAAVVDRVHTGFLAEFWKVVQEAIDLVGCEVFAFKPTSGTFEPTDNSLMSFHYFFIDLHRGRILFIGSVTKSRGSARTGVDSDSDVMLSQDSASSVTSKGRGSSDMGSSLQEGEFAFSDGSGDEGMRD